MKIVTTLALAIATLAGCAQQVPMRPDGWVATSRATKPVAEAMAECRQQTESARIVLRPAPAGDGTQTATTTGTQVGMTRAELVGSCLRVRGYVPAQEASGGRSTS